MKLEILKQILVKSDDKWEGKFFLSNKKVVRFEVNKKTGWEQWGASNVYLGITLPIIEK